jgi:hypothetical protein
MPNDSGSDEIISKLNAEVVRQDQEIAHWRRKSDGLAASRHEHAKDANDKAKVIDFLEDKILEYWGHK